MEALLRDLRLAVRNLLKNRGFTLAALLCLGLGMGASSAIFSVVNTVLLKPLPFAEPERVVMIWNQFLLQDLPKVPASGRELFDLRDQTTVLEGIAAMTPQPVRLLRDEDLDELLASRVTASFFQVLGVKPALGRVFTPEEDVFGRNGVVVLTYKLWSERFGSDPRIIGQRITIDGSPVVVTGVLPKEFSFGTLPIELFVPLALSPDRLLPRDFRTATLVGKLKPGISLDQAQAEMDVIAQRFSREYPGSYPPGSGYRLSLIPAHEDLVGNVRTPLLVLLGATGLVLVISCLNVANLLLVRATTRAKEVAIRTALGSSRAILIRQFLTEGLVLSCLGAALGLLIAFWATRLVIANLANIPRLDQVRLDGGVLLFTLGLVLVTGVVFGLAPALQSTGKKSLREPLQEGGKTSGAANAGQRARSALVVAEIAIALVVLVGAGLMIQSFRKLLDVDPGFRTRNLLTARFIMKGPQYQGAWVLEFQRQLRDRVASLPRVKSAALASELPMGVGMNLKGDLVAEGKVLGPNEPPPVTGWRMVSPGYFETMEIPILRGRGFTSADHERAPEVVIVEEGLARRLWPDENPLGKRLKLNAPLPAQGGWRTVVGVTGHVRQNGLASSQGDQLYVPIAQYPSRMLTLVVRPASDAGDLVSPVRQSISELDRNLPVVFRTIEEVIEDSLTQRRFNTLLFLAFGAMALVLTLIGIYGVMAYSVAQRTRDMGIRMALGAQRGDVLRLIVGQGARLALLGLALGVAAAWGMTRLMLSLLYDVAATDLVTFVGVSLLLGVLALAASYFPARRAAKVDPVVALRYE
ncbi:MAG TPA: ABC transporter permease [Thermoanaerobaculia bacterium]